MLQGIYPIILACNGKPKINLDQDTDAWMRRLVILNLQTPDHEQHYGKLAEMILKTESAGILNWLLEGRAKPFRECRRVGVQLAADAFADSTLALLFFTVQVIDFQGGRV